MSNLVEPEETLEFKWGTKRGRGGKKKEVQFYESFRYDGVDYALYDDVFLYKEGEPDPYIGKLIKIWENQDKCIGKKVKVHWFFRPSEISNWTEKDTVLEKEIFLASNVDVGTWAVNPLESIAGKCNVVCTVKDDRNPQPSRQELELADYFFYRTFDVKRCAISDLTGDSVAGLEVKFVFNRKENENNSDAISDKKHEGERPTSVDAIDSSDVKRISIQRTLSNEKVTSLSRSSENNKMEKLNALPIKAEVEDEDEAKLAKRSSALEKKLPSKSVADGSEASCKNRTTKVMETLKIEVNNSKPLERASSFSDKKRKGREGMDSARQDKLVKAAKSDNPITKDENKDAFQKLDIISDRNSGQDLVSWKKRKPTEEGTDSARPDKLGKAAKSDNPITKDENKDGFRKLDVISDKNGGKDLVSAKKRKPTEDGIGPDKGPKQFKAGEKKAKLSDGGKLKISATDSAIQGKSGAEVTRRPNDDKKKWFKLPPWEDRIKSAYQQGTLVLLSNLDPRCTSKEIEEIIWDAFSVECTAKMVQRTKTSSPHHGHAFIIVKTKAGADTIIKRLEDGCLMHSNARPLVGSRAPPLNFPGKQSMFFGHLSINKMKHQMPRDVREAVSTSHFSQPNTIEYEMAMEWCLMQSRSSVWWKRLYKQQGEELRKLKENLKSM